MGFFWVVWCLLACFVPVRSTPRHFLFVVSCWSLIMGERTNYSWMACVRIYAGWGIGDPTGADCLWTRRLAATSRTSAWRSLIPHLVINPSTMAARTSSSLWVLLPNFSPCRWTQRWWWSSSWHDHRNRSVDHDLKSLNSQQKAESVTVVVGLNRRECRWMERFTTTKLWRNQWRNTITTPTAIAKSSLIWWAPCPDHDGYKRKSTSWTQVGICIAVVVGHLTMKFLLGFFLCTTWICFEIDWRCEVLFCFVCKRNRRSWTWLMMTILVWGCGRGSSGHAGRNVLVCACGFTRQVLHRRARPNRHYPTLPWLGKRRYMHTTKLLLTPNSSNACVHACMHHDLQACSKQDQFLLTSKWFAWILRLASCWQHIHLVLTCLCWFLHLLLGAGAVYFASEMKALKDDCERFEIFPPGHIYSSKSGKVSSLLLAMYPQN